MNKKKALITSVTIISAIFFISSLTTQANAHMAEQPFGGKCEANIGPGEPNGWLGVGGADNFRHLGRYLDLSIEQRQKLHKIRFDLIKETIDLENELGQKRLERRALMGKDPIDWKKADKLTDEIAMLRAKLQKQRMRQRPKIKEILTPEQMEKFDEIRGWKGRSRCELPQQKRFGQPGQRPGLGRGPGW